MNVDRSMSFYSIKYLVKEIVSENASRIIGKWKLFAKT